MSKVKAFMDGKFGFWKFVIVTMVSMAFSLGVIYSTFGSGIKANAKEMEDLIIREQSNKATFMELVNTVNTMHGDLREVKTDVKWLVRNVN